MNDLDLLKDFRAERAGEDAEARAEVRQALRERFEAACAAPAPVAPSTPRRRPTFRRRHLLRRRRVFAFAGATAVAIATAGTLVLGGATTAQATAARILRETARIAVSPAAPTSSPQPGPGQLLYTKVKQVQLEGWIGDCDLLAAHAAARACATLGGTMSGPNAFNALMPTTREEWLGEGGVGRRRWVAGTPEFWSDAERGRWEAAGSPLPPPFDPGYQRQVAQLQSEEGTSGNSEKTLEEGPGVVDTETTVDLSQLKGHPYRFPDTSKLPTDPKALRHAVEANRVKVSGLDIPDPAAKHLDSEATTNELLAILSELQPMTPQLRAALFDALAELPGIEVDTHATDSTGRKGYAIRSIEKQHGTGVEYIFDPDTAEILAKRTFLADPSRTPYLKGVPAGSTLSETDYLETAIVDSTHETGSKRKRGPVAHVGIDSNREDAAK